MTASVEGLETGFYTRGSSVKRDNSSLTHKRLSLSAAVDVQGGWTHTGEQAGCACQRNMNDGGIIDDRTFEFIHLRETQRKTNQKKGERDGETTRPLIRLTFSPSGSLRRATR